MSFFGELPDPPAPQRQPQPEWIGPSRRELPVPVAVELLVGRSDRAAILLGPVRVYSNGLELELTVLVRGDPREVRFDPLHLHPRNAKEDVLRFALVCSDGSTAEVIRGFGGDEKPPKRVLMPRGGGGGEGRWDHRLWSWPLPPPGPLAVVCWWPKFDVPETRTELDAQQFLAAAARVETLWPDEDGGSVGSGGWRTTYVSSSDG